MINNCTHCINSRMIIVKMFLKDNITVKQLSQDFFTSKTSIYNWIKKYKDEIYKKENEWILNYGNCENWIKSIKKSMENE